MLIMLLPITALATSFSGGLGSSASPYLISTATDLAQLSTDVENGNSYSGVFFQMTDNINLNSGVTFTFDADTGFVTVTNGIKTFYLGTGVKGDTSGTIAGTAGMIYSDTAMTTGTDTIGLHGRPSVYYISIVHGHHGEHVHQRVKPNAVGDWSQIAPRKMSVWSTASSLIASAEIPRAVL